MFGVERQKFMKEAQGMLLEKENDTKVEVVHFKDLLFFEWLADQRTSETRSIILSTRFAVVAA